MPDQHCLNCGALLRGPYCHACGQPVKGMIRHFRSVIGDALDTVFEYDARIWRTLLPLYFIPGRLTLDFLAGRRIRFVTPFRLVFVLLVLAFLVLQLTVQPTRMLVDPEVAGGLYDATTVPEAEAARDRALGRIEQALTASRAEDPGGEGLAQRLETAKRAVRGETARRIEWLEAVEAARLAGEEPPPEPLPRPMLYLEDEAEPWNPVTNPVEIDWLPDGVNRQLNQWIERGLENARLAQEEPARFVEAFLGLLPPALFVLMPIFALLLKLVYLFTGRLYMSHMVVTLHSHAFLGMALLVSTALESLAGWVPEGAGLRASLDFAHGLSLAWVPAYLLIMQRRVYAQGWPLTLVKFIALGSIYTVLLALTLSAAAVITLVTG